VPLVDRDVLAGVVDRRAAALAAGQLGPDADSDDAVYLVSTLITGVLSQAIANEPDLPWARAASPRYSPKLIKLLGAPYPF
jgi:hypothetical protein